MNVVIIILDSLRRDHVGAYGNDWIETPNIDRLAESACIFDRAFPESLPTIPVRRAIHTGMRTFPFEDYRPIKGDHVKMYGWQPIPQYQATMAETLRGKGYRTAFFTDVYHQFKPSMNFHRGFSEWRWIRGQEIDPFNSSLEEHIEPYLTASGKGNGKVLRRYLANTSFRQSEEDWFAAQVFRQSMDWLRRNQDADQFLLCVDSFDPHEPWDPPPRYVDLYDPDYDGKKVMHPRYRNWRDYLTARELQHMKARYAGEVTMVDYWLGNFLELLDTVSDPENTLLVLISDHGHQLGEHGPTGKVASGLYPELMDIPFLIRDPEGAGAGHHFGEFVYNHDIFRTVFSYLDISPPGTPDGMDLRPLIEHETERTREYVTSGFSSYGWIRDEDYCLIARAGSDDVRLYDLDEDPQQSENVAQDRPDEAKRLHRLLLSDAGGSLPDYSLEIEKMESGG